MTAAGDNRDPAEQTELVASRARDTKSIYRAARASIQIAGYGYQVDLSLTEDVGFDKDDSAPAHPAPRVLVITTGQAPTPKGGLVSRYPLWPRDVVGVYSPFAFTLPDRPVRHRSVADRARGRGKVTAATPRRARYRRIELDPF